MLHSTSRLTPANTPSHLTICTECLGMGQISPSGHGPMCCWRCDGKGRVRFDEPKETASAPAGWFIALHGHDLIESGTSLSDLIREMSEGWDTENLGDLAIWHVVSGVECRLMAVVRATAKGTVVVNL